MQGVQLPHSLPWQVSPEQQSALPRQPAPVTPHEVRQRYELTPVVTDVQYGAAPQQLEVPQP